MPEHEEWSQPPAPMPKFAKHTYSDDDAPGELQNVDNTKHSSWKVSGRPYNPLYAARNDGMFVRAVEKELKDMATKIRTQPAEILTTDPDTGGMKGTKLARFDLIPPDVLWALAEHYGIGSQKYDDRNWERSYDWKLSYAAAQRHMNQFWSGEDVDAETGSLHTIAAAWHMFALTAFQLRKIGKDSRAVQYSFWKENMP